MNFNISDVLAAVIFDLRTDNLHKSGKRAIAQIDEWASEVDPNKIYIGVLYEGSRFIEQERVRQELRVSFEYARAVLAYFAWSAIESSPMVIGFNFLRLGMFLENFRAVWIDHPGFREVEKSVREALPYLDVIEDVWRRSHFAAAPLEAEPCYTPRC